MGTKSNMWIQTDNEALQSLYNAELMDETVEFSDNGKSQVHEGVGEALIEHYDDIKASE